MTLLPLFFELRHPRRFNDQHFALRLMCENMHPFTASQAPKPFKGNSPPLKQPFNKACDLLLNMTSDKKAVQIEVDVQKFAPDGVSVKTVDGFVVIEASHEEKKDQHGWVSRKFTRRFLLPNGCNTDLSHSWMSPDGVLTIMLPYKLTQADERIIPVVHMGPAKTKAEGVNPESGDSSDHSTGNGQ